MMKRDNTESICTKRAVHTLELILFHHNFLFYINGFFLIIMFSYNNVVFL